MFTDGIAVVGSTLLGAGTITGVHVVVATIAAIAGVTTVVIAAGVIVTVIVAAHIVQGVAAGQTVMVAAFAANNFGNRIA